MVYNLSKLTQISNSLTPAGITWLLKFGLHSRLMAAEGM